MAGLLRCRGWTGARHLSRRGSRQDLPCQGVAPASDRKGPGMSQMKELLDREAHRIEADPRALDSVYRTGERRQRNRRIGTIISALAIFVAAVAFVTSAIGSARSVPADQTPDIDRRNGNIVVRALVGEREGAILQIDPTTSEEVALPVAASARDLVWPGMGTGAFTDLSTSPDGTALAYVWSNDVWVLNIASGASRKIV